MTGGEITALATRLLGSIDAEAADVLSEAVLVAALKDAVRYYAVQQVVEFAAFTVDVDAFDADSAITPEPNDQLGVILAHTMAANLAQQAFTGRMRRGELGVSWRSGVEEESSVTAAANYKSLIAAMNTRVRELLLVFHREAQGARIY